MQISLHKTDMRYYKRWYPDRAAIYISIPVGPYESTWQYIPDDYGKPVLVFYSMHYGQTVAKVFSLSEIFNAISKTTPFEGDIPELSFDICGHYHVIITVKWKNFKREVIGLYTKNEHGFFISYGEEADDDDCC